MNPSLSSPMGNRRWALGLVFFVLGAVSACSTPKPEPLPLAPLLPVVETDLVWSQQLGVAAETMRPHTTSGRIWLANAAGTLSVLNSQTGEPLWRLDLGQPVVTGVGSDGHTAAVITRDNHLVVAAEGQERWRVRLPSATFTPPLVAGLRVFVLGGDRSISAFDANSGERLWRQTRSADPLVLLQPGVLSAVGDTLVVGLSGRLLGLDPSGGQSRWETVVSAPRGSNEVERLVDLVGPPGRVGKGLCVRSFGTAVACVDASNGRLAWTTNARSGFGLAADEERVYGVEEDGRVVAWSRKDGSRVWDNDRLRFRGLSAPLAVGRVVAIGDAQGTLHLLSRDDGSDLARLSTDGSAVLGPPVLDGQLMIVQTRKGGVYAWRPR